MSHCYSLLRFGGFQLHFVHLPFAGCDFSNCIDLLIEVDALPFDFFRDFGEWTRRGDLGDGPQITIFGGAKGKTTNRSSIYYVYCVYWHVSKNLPMVVVSYPMMPQSLDRCR